MKKGLVKAFGVVGIILTLVLGLQAFSHAALNYRTTYVSSTGTGIVHILVNPAIYSAIYDPSLKQYVADLEAEGHYVILNVYYGGTPQDIKNYCKMFISSSPRIKGMVLVGDLPVAKFENSTNDYAIFPCDEFYMDLVTQYYDTNANGIYDSRDIASSPTRDSSIWVSRLTASTVVRSDMAEVAMLKNYFAKNHSYRLGKLAINKRALEYIDDDHAGLFTGLDKAYPGCLKISDPNTTTAADYRVRLTQNYEWLHLVAHSDPGCHLFKIWSDWETYFYSSEVPKIEPKVLFYFVGGCSSCKFDASNYMGGNYVFAKQSGLIALGSTNIWKAGFGTIQNLYSTVREKNIGEASKDWLIGPYGGFPYDNIGATVIGDGTLRLDPPIPTINSINPATVETGKAVTFSGSGSVPSASIVGYSWRSNINGYLGGSATVSTSALSAGTHNIYFKVKDSKGRWSSEAQGTLVVIPIAAPSIAAPSNLTASPRSNTQVLLTWKDNSSLETGSKIYMSKDNVTFSLVGGGTVGANVTSFTVNNLVAGTKYYFKVMAYNTTAMSAYSNVATAIPQIPLPTAPTSLAATAASKSVYLSWTDNSFNEDSFEIQFSKDNVTYTRAKIMTSATVLSTGVKVGSTVSSLITGTRYYFRVRAQNATGNSSYSNVVAATAL